VAGRKAPGQLDNLAQLVYAGINGVDAGRGNGTRPKIMIHIDRGGDIKGTKAFLDRLDSYRVPYDIIGQSYYPWWHGSINDLRATWNLWPRRITKTSSWWKSPTTGSRATTLTSPPRSRNRRKDNGFSRRSKPCRDGNSWWTRERYFLVGAGGRGPSGDPGLFDDQYNALPAMTVFDHFARK